ncbi:hypothetical protein RV12_GL002193 [Enterococcus quebecensis]|nr:hypothetical protein RV12_GL002193 [Enterococcus quebecensis]
MRRRLEQKKKQYIKRFVVAMIISGISVGTGLYARYYQMTNLSANDGNAIIQSYFLMDEINKNLIGIQNGADTKKTKDKLLELTSLLASYGTTTPSNALSKDGQRILNRYYAQIRDYSTGLYSQKEEQLNDEGLILEYLEDSKRITGTQKKIFKQFSINESALKQKK